MLVALERILKGLFVGGTFVSFLVPGLLVSSLSTPVPSFELPLFSSFSTNPFFSSAGGVFFSSLSSLFRSFNTQASLNSFLLFCSCLIVPFLSLFPPLISFDDSILPLFSLNNGPPPTSWTCSRDFSSWSLSKLGSLNRWSFFSFFTTSFSTRTLPFSSHLGCKIRYFFLCSCTS